MTDRRNPDSGWTALVPFKPPGSRKTRLASRLDAAARDQLSEVLFRHVMSILQTMPIITKITILSVNGIPGWDVLRIEDQGRGLNEEVAAAQTQLSAPNLLVIHADLPFVTDTEINIMLRSCMAGGAIIAPDRHKSGTNAIALSGVPNFPFAFGEASFQSHIAIPKTSALYEKCPGLALDIDTPSDLLLALQLGFRF